MNAVRQKKRESVETIPESSCAPQDGNVTLRFPGAGEISVPFWKGINHVVVPVTGSGGRNYSFFIDTGASMSAVTPGFLRSSHSRLMGEFEDGSVHGARGAITGAMRQVEIPYLGLGGLTVRNLAAIMLDLGSLTETVGKEIHGIIGYNFLSRVLTRIHYRSGIITFAPPDAKSICEAPGDPGFTVPFELSMGAMIVVRGAVNGSMELPFIVDTGSRFTFLNRRAVEESGIAFSVPAEPTVPLGLGSAPGLSVAVGRGESFRIGDVSFQDPELYAIELPVFATLGMVDRPAGVLGNDLLQNFIVGIDYRKKNLRFLPANLNHGK